MSWFSRPKPILLRLRFTPAPDITAHELATILSHVDVLPLREITAHPADWYDAPPALKRHFTEVPL